jgi:lysophospholipase L1-like esterase
MLSPRLLSLIAGLTLGACAAPTSDSVGASEAAVEASGPHILSLGDSISFGWNPYLEADLKKVDAKKYPGFTDLLGKRLGVPVDNAACTGEASGSMLDAHAEDNGCRANRAAYDLHYPWRTVTGTEPTTQVAFATSYLTKAIAAGTPPKLITLTIGGNDLLLLQNHCDLPSPLHEACELVKLPFYVHDYGEHLTSLLTAIDATGYKGTLVVLTTYAPDYSDRIATLGLDQTNGELKDHVGKASQQLHGLKVRIADGYGAFKAHADRHGGNTCETGLLIKNPDGKTCDIHPTAAGHQVLADAILAAAGPL